MQRKTVYSGNYAFVGYGSHSAMNLYPVLGFLQVNLKYIVTKTAESAQWLSTRYPKLICTIDLEQVLKDETVQGVFICTHPDSHFALISRVLKAGKNVFVEKPPCKTVEELAVLINLEKNNHATCVVGLQRRFAPSSQTLINKINSSKLISYSYRYITGAYPEGDVMTDIFIHPIDFLNNIFGTPMILSVQKTKTGNSIFLQLKHGEAIGNVEISTEYSWKGANERLLVNTVDEVYELDNQEKLTRTGKPKTLLSIPLEKIIPVITKEEILFSQNSFTPDLQNNSLYVQGYFSEVKSFLDICEKKNKKNYASLESLVGTYEIISKIR